MGRVRGGPAVQQPAESTAQQSGLSLVSLDGAHIVEIGLAGLDRARLESMREAGIRLRQPAVGEMVREAAARAQALTPFTSEQSDVECFRGIVRLFVAYFYQTGFVDARRALRRTNVDRYLVENSLHTRRTARWQLYKAGRAMYPNEFPPANVVEAPRLTATPPSTDADVAALYSIARTLNPHWRQVLVCVLDFIGGVGARPSELKHLRRDDVTVEMLDGRAWTVVTLHTPSRSPRRVPVWDQHLAGRIQDHAAHARHGHVMAFGSSPTVQRNAVNRINERLAERGYAERIDSKALRNRWLGEIVGILPMGQFLQVAGLATTVRVDEVITDLREFDDLDSIAAAFAAASGREEQ